MPDNLTQIGLSRSWKFLRCAILSYDRRGNFPLFRSSEILDFITVTLEINRNVTVSIDTIRVLSEKIHLIHFLQLVQIFAQAVMFTLHHR